MNHQSILLWAKTFVSRCQPTLTFFEPWPDFVSYLCWNTWYAINKNFQDFTSLNLQKHKGWGNDCTLRVYMACELLRYTVELREYFGYFCITDERQDYKSHIVIVIDYCTPSLYWYTLSNNHYLEITRGK